MGRRRFLALEGIGDRPGRETWTGRAGDRDPCQGALEPDDRASGRAFGPRGEGLLAKDGPLVVKTGKHTGRSARTSSPCDDAHRHDRLVGQDQQADGPEHSTALNAGFPRRARRKGHAVRAGPVRRLAARTPGEGARDQRICLAQPVHPHPAGAPRSGRAGRLRARIYDHRPAQLQGRSGPPRLPQRDRDRGQFEGRS
jgi:hypothetical protein